MTCGLATPAVPTLPSRPGVLDSEVVCLMSILTRLPSPRSWSTPVSNSPPREAPWSFNPSSYPLERTAGDIAQLSLPSRGAALSEEPQLLTAEPLSPCPGFPWPRLFAPLEPSHLERERDLPQEEVGETLEPPGAKNELACAQLVEDLNSKRVPDAGHPLGACKVEVRREAVLLHFPSQGLRTKVGAKT